MTVYVAHKGESVVAIGTLEEVANSLGVTMKTVQFWASPANHSKWRRYAKSNRMVVDRVEVSE